MGVVGTQQLTVNGDKALQTAVNTLTCCLSRSVHYVSHECLYDTMCVCDCEQKTHFKPDISTIDTIVCSLNLALSLEQEKK